METTEKALAKRPKPFAWLPVILLIIVAMAIRFWQNSSANYLLVGGDGPYYPLQTRSMLEQFKLALPDMPLLFIIEALMAKVLYLLNYSSENACVLMAVKLTDAVLPPLAAIPVCLISRESKSPNINAQWFNYIIMCYAIINPTTIIVFSSGLQKNAFAVVWLFAGLYFLIRYIKNEQKKDLYLIITILLFCVITHFGSFSVLLFLMMITGITWLCYNPKHLKHVTAKHLLMMGCVITILITIIGYYDPGRLLRLVKIPLKIAEYPVLLMMLQGDDVGLFFSPAHMIIASLLALIALFILLRNRKKTGKEDKIIQVSLIISAFLLSSPLIGLEWANRLYVLSYIPVTVLYVFIFSRTASVLSKIVPAAIFSLLIILSALNVRPNNEVISNEAYEEFREIKNKVDFTKRTVVIGRQDLRLLASWEFRTKSASDYLFTKNDFNNYANVFVIRQVKGSNFSAERFRGDAPIPDNSIKVYSGTCFELYRIKDSTGWEGGKGKPVGARGKIIRFDKNTLAVQNKKTGSIRIVEFNQEVLMQFKNGKHELTNGTCIEVYGKRKAFSLHLIAESITEMECEK